MSFNATVQTPTGTIGEYTHIAEVIYADQMDVDSSANNDDGDQSEDDEDNIDNLPNNSLPYFMKQTIGKHEKDLYDINSQAVFMNIYEKNSSLNMIRKVVASKKPRHRKKK